MSRAQKAAENLRAGELLLEGGLVNAAANRLYYAAFQAGVHALESKGKHWTDFRDNAKTWEHGMIAGNSSLIRGFFRKICGRDLAIRSA